MVQAFRKELSDLRQRDIERATASPRTAPRPKRRPISAALAAALHRIADRLEPAPDVAVESRPLVVHER